MALPGDKDGAACSDLHRQLLGCPALLNADHIVVGFSGGLDSTVLLQLLADLGRQGLLSARLSALHVHHGLQPEAELWLQQCRARVQALGLGWIERRVQVQLQAGCSLEAAAREARYAVFSEVLQPGSVLALAHHADDQVETVLLHLLRGSGPRGLAGMPQQRALGQGLLCRPLLAVPRARLQQQARASGLQWVEDQSNQDPRFTRNRLRHEVLPALQAMAPGLASSVARSAGLCIEAETLLQELAQADLAAARCEQPNQLQVAALAALTPVRLRNALRCWVQELQGPLNGASITHEALQQCRSSLLESRADASPVLAWGEGERRLELRRYRQRLYLVKPMPQLPDSLDWNPAELLPLPGVLGSLQCPAALAVAGRGWPQLTVRFRSGGERVALAGRPQRSLKALLQEAGLPPWLRPCVPLVYCGEQLLAVADLFTCSGWPAQVPEKTAGFLWQRQHLHCGH
jgi:tRNA(Ile)-lysidine synthase